MRLATVLLGLLALPLAASAQNEIYTSVLSGANEVPPNASTATGSVTLTVDPGTLGWTLSGSYTGMSSTVTASHIHTGAAGVNGPVLFTLTNTGGTAGTLSGAGTFSPTQLSTLRASGLYVNVHTTSFPGGELRDQLRFAVPSVDGDCDDPNYQLLGSYTQGRGFGDWGLKSFKGYRDATHLYVCVEGTIEGNQNNLYTWIDVSDRTTGANAGTQLQGAGAFADGFQSARPTLELPNTDFGFRVKLDNGVGYVNAATYAGATPTLSYLGSLTPDGSTASESQGGPFAGATFAYRHKAGGVSTNTDGSGFEFKLELADLGASGTGTIRGEEQPAAFASMATSTFQMFTAYASGDGSFFSSDVIPEVPGNGSNNLANDPNFVALPGTQATTSSALPVELSAFTAVADGDAAIVRWTTESETNNAGFDLQTLRSGAWTTVATATGRGTTSERQTYQERVEGLATGRHTFRLVQRDLDGTATIAGTVELVVGAGNALVAETRGASVRFGAAAAQPLTVEAFDVLGRRVATLFAGAVEAGAVQSAELTGVAPGVYVVRVAGRAGIASATLVVR